MTVPKFTLVFLGSLGGGLNPSHVIQTHCQIWKHFGSSAQTPEIMARMQVAFKGRSAGASQKANKACNHAPPRGPRLRFRRCSSRQRSNRAIQRSQR